MASGATVRAIHTADYPPPPAGEPHWPPLLIIALTIALQALLPARLIAGPRWLLPVLQAVLLLALLISAPFKLTGRHVIRRRLGIMTAALVSIANGISLVLLVRVLMSHNVRDGRSLVVAGAEIWLTNVFTFSLWYWEVDRGGPGIRAAGEDDAPGFLFPQMSTPDLTPGWRPKFIDYLYVSLTNAAAFSPTDTMPLSATAKSIMSLQSVISLVTMGLVVARAVNIL